MDSYQDTPVTFPNPHTPLFSPSRTAGRFFRLSLPLFSPPPTSSSLTRHTANRGERQKHQKSPRPRRERGKAGARARRRSGERTWPWRRPRLGPAATSTTSSSSSSSATAARTSYSAPQPLPSLLLLSPKFVAPASGFVDASEAWLARMRPWLNRFTASSWLFTLTCLALFAAPGRQTCSATFASLNGLWFGPNSTDCCCERFNGDSGVVVGDWYRAKMHMLIDLVVWLTFFCW